MADKLPRYHDRAARFGPVQSWNFSRRLYAKGHFRAAKALKAINLVLFRAFLPPECAVGDDMRLEHWGHNVGIHPNTDFGDRCVLYTGASFISTAAIGSNDRIIVGSDVVIGTNAVIMNRIGRTLRIGDRAQIGANALVVADVPADTNVHAPLGTLVPAKARR